MNVLSATADIADIAAMDDSELPSSPRKKLKTDDSQLSGKMEEANATPLVEPEPYDEQLQKEVDVGITEFVSPELSGFSGVLKKRCSCELIARRCRG